MNDIMEVKIKHNEELIDATIEMIDGVMVVTPKEVEKEEVDYSQFKDGDIITCGWEDDDECYEWMCVLKGDIEEDSALFMEHYCCLDLKWPKGVCKLSTTPGFSDTATYARYATEEDKQKFFDALAKEGKAWDAEKKAVVYLKYMPKDGNLYYFPVYSVHLGFNPYRERWKGNDIDFARYDKGFIYPDTIAGKDRCQDLCDRLNEAINSVKP